MFHLEDSTAGTRTVAGDRCLLLERLEDRIVLDGEVADAPDVQGQQVQAEQVDNLGWIYVDNGWWYNDDGQGWWYNQNTDWWWNEQTQWWFSDSQAGWGQWYHGQHEYYMQQTSTSNWYWFDDIHQFQPGGQWEAMFTWAFDSNLHKYYYNDWYGSYVYYCNFDGSNNYWVIDPHEYWYWDHIQGDWYWTNPSTQAWDITYDQTFTVTNHFGGAIDVYLTFAHLYWVEYDTSAFSGFAQKPGFEDIWVYENLAVDATATITFHHVHRLDGTSIEFSPQGQALDNAVQTRFEWTLHANDGTQPHARDIYNLSLVNGYNGGMSIVPTSGTNIQVTDATGNENALGVYGLGCDTQTAAVSPPYDYYKNSDNTYYYEAHPAGIGVEIYQQAGPTNFAVEILPNTGFNFHWKTHSNPPDPIYPV